MIAPCSLLAPKATPFPLRETTAQKISADDVHSANNNLENYVKEEATDSEGDEDKAQEGLSQSQED